eukprot:scaffold158436_cov41-Attheya_sp.AAC.1
MEHSFNFLEDFDWSSSCSCRYRMPLERAYRYLEPTLRTYHHQLGTGGCPSSSLTRFLVVRTR